MTTKFGPEAKNGDYVIVLDVDYVHRRARNLIARVHNNKAYTGIWMYSSSGKQKYLHKLEAQIVIPESIVDEETKKFIEEDIKIHIKGDK
jgi:hypothetical protein